MALKTYHIKIEGMVQGVGFRPLVYKVANNFGLTGWVNNATDGVHIRFNANDKTAREFYERIIEDSPHLSNITSHSISEIDPENFNSFEIVESEPGAEPNLMLTPDFAMCGTCKSELNDPDSRRYQYPFITCTQCGPRYSIITSLPYDRATTTMHSFAMCDQCKKEYNDPDNRRYYSQTNSCEECAIKMEIYDPRVNKLFSDNISIVNEVAAKLAEGKIVAVKGIGGYLLLADAANLASIKRLRQKKHRPSKPFAIMFPSIELVKKVAVLEEREERYLKDISAPIVLVRLRENSRDYLYVDEIAPHLSRIGVMLPYAPLFELILQKFGKPVIATSANISESPIISKDEDALKSLSPIADFVVTNNREVITPQDDSVIQFTRFSKQEIVIRRSRGMAPSYFNYDCKTGETILATGALLKSSFTFVNNGNTFVSQYLGSTESYEAQEVYSKTAQHFFYLFNSKPQTILTDKHPRYFSNLFAKKLGEELKIDVKEIQHHKAHFAAVLAENNLIQSQKGHQIRFSEKAVLGVIWDGTGQGDDGNIWGGEFFRYEENTMTRWGHFEYFPHILGDKMAREPRISALATCARSEAIDQILKNKFTEIEWKLYKKMVTNSVVPGLEKIDRRLQCSSVGRIFDAVASMLNLSDKQSYEGEAAMLLQEEASSYIAANGLSMIQSYFEKNIDCRNIPTALLVQGIMDDIQNKESIQFIAAKFHYSLVHLVDNVAIAAGTNKIAFSGGVFLNSVLVDLLQHHLGNRYQLYFHKNLSPNDENISFGQVVYYDNKIDKEYKGESNNKDVTGREFREITVLKN